MTFGSWITSGPHETPPSIPERAPWGTRHARIGGAPRSACGMSAVTWKVFWNLPFRTSHPDACPDCRDAVLQVNARARLDG
jgi:hypothetical protein